MLCATAHSLLLYLEKIMSLTIIYSDKIEVIMKARILCRLKFRISSMRFQSPLFVIEQVIFVTIY